MLPKALVTLLMSSFFLSASCKSQTTLLETVPYVDLARYSGKWYEIASYPQRFQKGCTYTTAEYSIGENGLVIVENRCQRNGKISGIKGKAKVVKNSGNAKLKVSFFWPFQGDYWIIDLADDYSYAVVSNPGQKYLWILSRTNTINENTLLAIITKLKAKGFDTGKLQYTKQ
jgi:apolipoprotein D and lipocalin family protein